MGSSAGDGSRVCLRGGAMPMLRELAEVGLDDHRILNNLDRGALGDFLPVVQHDEPPGKFEDGRYDVFDPDQCDASLMNRMDEVP